jgi:hypothetical protein
VTTDDEDRTLGTLCRTIDLGFVLDPRLPTRVVVIGTFSLGSLLSKLARSITSDTLIPADYKMAEIVNSAPAEERKLAATLVQEMMLSVASACFDMANQIFDEDTSDDPPDFTPPSNNNLN